MKSLDIEVANALSAEHPLVFSGLQVVKLAEVDAVASLLWSVRDGKVPLKSEDEESSSDVASAFPENKAVNSNKL